MTDNAVANEEHLQIIRQGVDVWNEWRAKNPGLIPDLTGADLREAGLSGAHLFQAHLSGANLSEANLNGAGLREANLSRANLREADLSGANLYEANVRGADLRGADLRQANLYAADLRQANLIEAHLLEASLSGAMLSGAHLSQADLHAADLRAANLSGAILSGAHLSQADLHQADLRQAHLSGADLREADLSQANLSGADLRKANLSGADLSEADLRGANLVRADLSGADLSGADLSEADLRGANLVRADLCNATLLGSYVYGVSVWDMKVNDQTKQQNLVITPPEHAAITVDNIKVAQFIYLLLNNQEIRDVIDTITSKAVLILGRFSEERKPVLDAIRNELRNRDYLPIMFDFPSTTNQATLETIKTLASMARFVIADLTDARSVLMELGAVVPAFPAVAVRLMIKKSEPEYGTLDSIRSYRSVVENTYAYEDDKGVIASIKENVIGPAEAKVKELRTRN